MRLLALALCLTPGTGLAQQTVFDVEKTSYCVAADGGMDCVGLSANACMELSEGGYSTHGMSNCTDLELDWWDARLNKVYGLAKAQAMEMDADAPEYAPRQADALKEMQRAWIGFRDAKCQFVASEWMGGTGAGPATLWCLMEETARQALYLEGRHAN